MEKQKTNWMKMITFIILGIFFVGFVIQSYNNSQEKKYWEEKILYGNWEYLDYESYENSKDCPNPFCNVIDSPYKKTEVRECLCSNGNKLRVIGTSKQSYYEYKQFDSLNIQEDLNETI